MGNDLQKAGVWKRIAAWMLDWILICVLAVGLGAGLSALIHYDNYSQTLDACYAKYEAEFGVSFDVTQDSYNAMTQEERQAYDNAYNALNADEEAVRAYNMMIRMSLLIITAGIMLAVLLLQFVVPLVLGNGQTIGKKVFGLCLIRSDTVKVNSMQLFARAILGQFAVETMIPLYIVFMIFWGAMDVTGTLVVTALLIGQILCVALTKTNSAIHDLLAGTVVVDLYSQKIFRSTEDLISWQKKTAAEKASRQAY